MDPALNSAFKSVASVITLSGSFYCQTLIEIVHCGLSHFIYLIQQKYKVDTYVYV